MGRRPLAEIALLTAIGIASVAGCVGASLGDPDRRPLDALGYLLILAGPALLPLRHRRPLPALLGVLATAVGYYGLDYPRGPVFLSLTVAVFAAVLAGHRVAAWSSTLLGLAGYFVLDWWVRGQGPTPEWIIVHVPWVLLMLTVAELERYRRHRVTQARAVRAETERRRISEARLGIAHELHDVLGHSISLITVQANVGLHLMDREPDRARSALQAIKDTSRRMLADVQAALDVLRRDEAAGPLEPAPGLDRLDDLVSRFADAGLRVTVTTRGSRRPPGASADLAAYRIVQEALTNSGSPRADVLLDYRNDTLEITVVDHGARTGDPSTVGMRERAVAAGGTLSAGPDPAGGFRVVARLPLAQERSHLIG